MLLGLGIACSYHKLLCLGFADVLGGIDLPTGLGRFKLQEELGVWQAGIGSHICKFPVTVVSYSVNYFTSIIHYVNHGLKEQYNNLFYKAQ